MSRAVFTVADTVLGYGSTQILIVTKGLAKIIGGDHRIFQPFVPNRKFIDLSNEGYCIDTVTTVEHPWSWIGRMQYLRRVAKSINAYRPDVLVLPNYNMIPIIDLLDYQPSKIIHLVLEDMEQFGESYWAQHIIRKIKQYVQKIDLWVFPEKNRAIHDCRVLGVPFNRVCLFYNVTTVARPYLPANERNGRIVYAGSVDFKRTVAHFLSSPSIASQAIDVFGNLSGSDEQKQDFLAATRLPQNQLRYFGEIPADTLANQLPHYTYSLVYWFPTNWALRNAAPNKFFQAVASGVPVISAPHPQCVSLIKRYGCGISLKDWEYGTFVSGLKTAVRKIGSNEYSDMVAGCKEAYLKELNFDCQLQKIAILLNREKDYL